MTRVEANDPVEKKEEEGKKSRGENKNAQIHCLQLAKVFSRFSIKENTEATGSWLWSKKNLCLFLERIVIPDSGTQHKHFDVNLKERRG